MTRILMSTLVACMVAMGSAAFAEKDKLSQADIQLAIEKFGIESAAAKIAAEHAMLVVNADSTVESDEIVVSLPADFLEGSPY